jgi:hypothetical protein
MMTLEGEGLKATVEYITNSFITAMYESGEYKETHVKLFVKNKLVYGVISDGLTLRVLRDNVCFR